MPYPGNRIASSNLARSASPLVAQIALAHPHMVGGTRHPEPRTTADLPCEGAAFPENGFHRAGNAAPPAESDPWRAFGTTATVRSTAGELHYLSDGGCSVLADDPARWRSPAARALVAGTDPGRVRAGGGAQPHAPVRSGEWAHDDATHLAPAGRGAWLYAGGPIATAGSRLTVRESRDAWLRDRRRLQLSPETRQSYRQSTDEFLAVVGADRAVGSLTIADLDRYLDLLESDARARGPLTPATKAGRIARVRAWLNWAHGEGDLATPLGQRLQPPPLAVTTPPPLPPEQIRAMLSQVGLRYQALLLILLDTGLRIGDALRLRRTDLRRSQDGQPYFEVAISKTHSGGQAPISATTT